jgi:transcriptional regulator with XRE-family HTH domain
MDMRQRIQSVIDSNPDLTVRNVSMAAHMSDSALNKFLTGQTNDMKIENAKAIAAAMKVDARWLIFGEGSPEEATSIADKIERLSERQRKSSSA